MFAGTAFDFEGLTLEFDVVAKPSAESMFAGAVIKNLKLISGMDSV